MQSLAVPSPAAAWAMVLSLPPTAATQLFIESIDWGKILEDTSAIQLQGDLETSQSTQVQCASTNDRPAVPEGEQKSTSTSLFDEFSTDTAVRSFLNSIGADRGCRSLAKVNREFIGMATNANGPVLLTREHEWLQVSLRLGQAISAVMNSETKSTERAALASPISESAFSGIYRAICLAARMDISPLVRQNLDYLTVSLVLTAAGNNLVLSDALGDGIRQCYQTLQMANENSRWLHIAQNAPVNCEAIGKLIDPKSSGVVSEFLRECHAILSLDIPAPPTQELDTGDNESDNAVSQATDGASSAIPTISSRNIRAKTTNPIGERTHQ